MVLSGKVDDDDRYNINKEKNQQSSSRRKTKVAMVELKTNSIGPKLKNYKQYFDSWSTSERSDIFCIRITRKKLYIQVCSKLLYTYLLQWPNRILFLLKHRTKHYAPPHMWLTMIPWLSPIPKHW